MRKQAPQVQNSYIPSKIADFKKIKAVFSGLQDQLQVKGLMMNIDEECLSVEISYPGGALRKKTISFQLAPDRSILILRDGSLDIMSEISKKSVTLLLSSFILELRKEVN